MNTEWSLEVYYKGYEDPAFAEDFELMHRRWRLHWGRQESRMMCRGL